MEAGMEGVTPSGGDGLTAATVSGGAWRTLSVFGGAVMQFVVSVVLARLLTPKDFGTLALVIVIVGFANTLAFLGVGPGLVQRRELTDRYVATAWTLSLIAGVAGFAVVAAAAPALAWLVGDPETTLVFVAISPTILLVGLRTCSLGLLRRGMRFRRLTLIELVSYGLGYALVALPLALLGWGVWSLVVAQLTQALVGTAMAVASARHRWALGFGRAELREIVNFGGGMTAIGVANYVALTGDNFVVGRALGASALGLYSRAYTLMYLPLNYVAQAQSHVLLPAYSRVQDDRPRMTRGFLSGVFLVFAFAAPAMAFMLVAAPSLVRTLYGPRWVGVIVPLQILALFGVFRAAYHLGGAVAQSLGKPWSEFLRQIVYAALVVGGAAVGSRWGIAGVAWGTGLAIFVMYVAMARLSRSLLGFTWREYVGAHGVGVVAGLVVLAVGAATREGLTALAWPDLWVLVTLIVVCVGVAFASVSLLPRSWRAEGADRVLIVALGMLPARPGAVLARLLRVRAPGCAPAPPRQR